MKGFSHHANSKQQPQIDQPSFMFPSLRHIIMTLLGKIQGEFSNNDYLRHIPYREVINGFENVDVLAEGLYTQQLGSWKANI